MIKAGWWKRVLAAGACMLGAASAQAAIIGRERPDLVGLQEVWAFACQDLTPGACAEPTIAAAFVDQLPVTEAALATRGLDYEVAGFIENFDTSEITVPGIPVPGLPFTINGRTDVLLAKDRDVILRRKGVSTQKVIFPGCRAIDDGCHFQTSLQVPLPAIPGATLEVKRGFLAVDATMRGRTYRFVNTHLEVERPDPTNPLSTAIQAGQAQELIARLGALPLPAQAELILVGDINSSPASKAPDGIVPPCRQLRRAGFYDAWLSRGGKGFTCCQDADLRNRRSKLYERIDVIMVRTRPVTVQGIEVVSDSPGERTMGSPRLWPADHAGVAARLRF